MATRTVSDHALRQPAAIDLGAERVVALGGLGLVTAASLTVLYRITVQMGATGRLALLVAIAILLAWVGARYLTGAAATATFGLLTLVSYVWYVIVVVDDHRLLVEAPMLIVMHTIDDAMAIATGQSVLAIIATDVWALAFAPAPLFLTWYFGFRRRYVAAGTVAGATMLVFVLSGDLGTWTTLLGSIGVVTAVGFGTIELTGASSRYAEGLLVLIAAMAVVALLLPLVPSGGALGPVSFVDSFESDDHTGLEASVVGTGDELRITGEIEMSPEVRYTISGEDRGYVRTAIYDYYTGSGWERTGEREPYATADRSYLGVPARTVEQTVTTHIATNRLPSAGGVMFIHDLETDRLELSDQGVVTAPDGLEAGETYRVVSSVPPRPDGSTPTSVPDEVDDRYLQLPDDVPDELHQLTEDLLADAAGPHEKAVRVASFLRNEKSYRHGVRVPDGDLATEFIFEMEGGYCTYFATAAVVMLRSADVPARMAVGYTRGQQIDETTSVVRGFNSHAWVEVYIDGYGWVDYEPTPAGPWGETRANILETAREQGVEGVDTEDSIGLPLDHDPSPATGADDPTVADGGNQSAPGGAQVDGDPFDDYLFDGYEIIAPDRESGGDVPTGEFGQAFIDLNTYRADVDPPEDEPPPVFGVMEWEQLAAVGVLGVGAIVSMRRYRVPARTRRQIGMRWQLGTTEPVADMTRSSARLEWAMRRRFRPRHRGETLRAYHRRYRVVHDDPTVDALFETVERARYAGEIDGELAARSVELASAVVDDTVVLGGRLRPSLPRGPGSVVDRIL